MWVFIVLSGSSREHKLQDLQACGQEQNGEEKLPKALCKLNKIQAEGEGQHCDYLELESELRRK